MNSFDVVIVGAGASGIGAAVKLGHTDFVVLEKAGEVGGTWRDNTYPGCACDVPSALYSYSFAPNPDWSRAFAGQAEILEYLRRIAAEYGVTERTRFGVEVRRAQWDDTTQRWRIETSDGEYQAKVLVGGTGPWHEPLVPDLGTFDGPSFHSSRWDHDVDLDGKRVAVIGTGASAVQFVPQIAPKVAQLHLFQRTAQWVLPKPDHFVPPAERWVFRNLPAVRRAVRRVEYAGMEALGIGFRHPRLMKTLQRIGSAHLRIAVRDPELRCTLTPDYTLGCKRLLMSNDYYPALTRPNVKVHGTAVREIRGNTVIGADGNESEVDVLIFGTGFRILDMPVAERVYDAAGRSLADHWQGSPRAYLGTAVSGFPNLFLLLGPNLGTGHTSAFMILEAQLSYAAEAIARLLRNNWSSIEVRPAAQAAYNAELQAALPTTVYNSGGCSSYYLDANGENSFSWPWSTSRLRRRVGSFEVSAYDVRTTTVVPR